MENLLLSEIANALDGELLWGAGDTEVSSITTDSRNATENSLYVPIRGERFDGHDFITAAFDNGALCSLIDKDVAMRCDKAVIRVDDTFLALKKLAGYYKSKFNVKTIAITGSVGKTTTKDIIYSVMSQKYNTLKTQGNYNNEIGLPLTIFNMENAHQAVVLEMGMSGFGEIHNLAEIAKPDIAIISNIGVSHIEKLGSKEGICKAKMEITDFFGKDNILFINGDDSLLRKNVKKNHSTITYGLNEDNNFVAYGITTNIDGVQFKCIINNKEEDFFINIAGKHNVYNALAAIAVGLKCDIDINSIKKGLKSVEFTAMRMSITNYGSISVINDCYNAAPDSVMAAIDVLMGIGAKRHVAVLGDILEMGDFAMDAHRQLGAYAAKHGVNMLICVGENSRHIREGAIASGMDKTNVLWFETTTKSAMVLASLIEQDDSWLIKASRGMKFERLIDCFENL